MIMPFFRRPSKENKGSPNNRESSFRQYQSENDNQIKRDLEALERGDIPDGAKNRITQTTNKELPWMSTFGIHDAYVGELLKITPVVQVTGSCYYHAATDVNNRIYLDSNFDAGNLIRAYYEAKGTAIDRLLIEAKLAGAHAVLDAVHRFRQDGTMVEFSIVGTAVRFNGIDAPATPIISPLSGEEFVKLLKVGYLPVGFALGYHWHCMPVGYLTQVANYSWSNQELTGPSERFMETREVAVDRMRKDARSHHLVHGIVGVKISSRVEPTEIKFSGGMGGGFYMDGTYYTYGPDGQVDVPAFNTEFFATGASIARIGTTQLTAGAIAAFLSARH